VGKNRFVREYEIGSEAWMRERIERGLDPAEADQPEDGRLLHFGVEFAAPVDRWPEVYWAQDLSDAQTSFEL
jgi:hypothetical protein